MTVGDRLFVIATTEVFGRELFVKSSNAAATGVTVTPISNNTTEAGGAASFSVSLDTQPTADVTIELSSDDLTEGTINKSLLTFASADWNTPQIVTVTGANDSVSDGDIVYYIVTAAAASADPAYSGLNAEDVTVVNIDNEVQSLVVSPPTLSVTEGGTTTFGVKLAFQPASNVTVDLAFGSGDGDLSVSGTTSLTFTPSDWNKAQNFTLAAAEDADTTNGTATFNVISTRLTTVDVAATEADNETAAVTIENVAAVEGSGLLFTVTLDYAVARGFDITVNFTDGTASGGTDYDATFVILHFLGTAGETQQFTVNTTTETTVEANETFSASLTSSDPLVDDTDTASGTITNDDSAIVTLTSQSKVEGTGAALTIFTFIINLSPPVDIPVSITANTVSGSATAPNDYAAVSGATVSFPANSTTAQSVNVSVVADSDYELDEAFDLVLSELFAPSRAVTFELAAATLAATANILHDGATVGSASSIIDDGDLGYSNSGSWVQVNRNGHNDDFRFAYPGGTSETSQWQFNGLTNGQYRVSVSYRAWSNRATNAPYTVHDGIAPLGTAHVNQELEAEDRFKSGIGCHDLGVFNILTGELPVLLTDIANDIVSADSVRIERIYEPIAGPEISISVNGDVIEDNTGVLDFGNVEHGSTLIRTITIHNSGTSELTISLPTLPAGFTLVGAAPTSPLAAGTSNTIDVEIDTSALGLRSGEISMTVNDSDENPFNFTIRATWFPPSRSSTTAVRATRHQSVGRLSNGTDFWQISILQHRETAAVSRALHSMSLRGRAIESPPHGERFQIVLQTLRLPFWMG
jgi:hypothetical protein